MTWEEFLDFARIIRPYTAEAMKIEVAPWIRDYVANMDELYTKLILEKIKNRQLNKEIIMLEDYVDLFNDREKETVNSEGSSSFRTQGKEQVNPTKIRNNKKKVFLEKAIQVDKGQLKKILGKKILGKKILGKGIPGIGKTTLLKKIGWDWAKGIFTDIELLFVVLLKLVKPEEAIEDAILAQMPQLEGMGVTPKRVKDILDTFGQKCLLILDGLDEHVLGENQDVIKIIKGQKHLNCNLFVTSRPHSTSRVEENFSTIVRVEGFGREEAAIFAEKLLHDKKKVEMVLNFKHAEFRGDNSLYRSPILLSFMCLLVREDDFDLTDTQIKVGEIYTRMVRCLYKKYTIRNNKEYTFEGFVKSIALVGKLALQTLISGDAFMRRMDIRKEVGAEAFDYGLLIGHTDAHTLIRDDTADIYVTFPHRSIQEFVGAFCLVQLLNEGKTLELLFEKEETSKLFLQAPLFLQFCLWFSYSGQKYFLFENDDYIRENLVKSIVNQIFLELNVPQLDIADAYNTNDHIRLSFFKDVLAKCSEVQFLVFAAGDPIDWVLTSMRPVLKGISTIHISEVLHLNIIERQQIVVHIKQFNESLVNCILTHCSSIIEYPSIHLHVMSKNIYQLNLSQILHANLTGLRIVSLGNTRLVAKGNLPFVPRLTALAFEGLVIEKETLKAFSKANETGSLCCLTHLSLINCTGVKSYLHFLFKSPWTCLKYINLYRTEIKFHDLQAMSNDTILPHVTSLILSADSRVTVNPQTVDKNFQSRFWKKITVLFLDNKTETSGPIYRYVLGRTHIPNLVKFGCRRNFDWSDIEFDNICLETVIVEWPGIVANRLEQVSLKTLDFSHSKYIADCLSIFQNRPFPTLRELILRNCLLKSKDLCTLAQAEVMGIFPKLKHLDISENFAELIYLFSNNCKWKNLVSLNIRRTKEPYGFEEIRPGHFTSLQEIRVSQHYMWYNRICWPNINKLYIEDCESSVLQELVNAVKCGRFRNLERVCVKFDTTELLKDDITAGLRGLAEIRIACHLASTIGHPFTLRKCVCQKIEDEIEEPRGSEHELKTIKRSNDSVDLKGEKKRQKVNCLRFFDILFKTLFVIVVVLLLLFNICVMIL